MLLLLSVSTEACDSPSGAKAEDTDMKVSKEFEEDMEEGADEAAQAAVTFADAVADQVIACKDLFHLPPET